jgi:hypothetical protein
MLWVKIRPQTRQKREGARSGLGATQKGLSRGGAGGEKAIKQGLAHSEGGASHPEPQRKKMRECGHDLSEPYHCLQNGNSNSEKN